MAHILDMHHGHVQKYIEMKMFLMKMAKMLKFSEKNPMI